jgi:outer membrane biogenesis lipoprotein LolB
MDIRGRPRRATIRIMSPVEKLRAALELHEVGVALMRQNLRRRHPDESEDAIEERLADWLRTRPGAEHGDAAGRPSGRTPP